MTSHSIWGLAGVMAAILLISLVAEYRRYSRYSRVSSSARELVSSIGGHRVSVQGIETHAVLYTASISYLNTDGTRITSLLLCTEQECMEEK